MQYCIPINEDDTAHIFFRTKDEKEDYIVKEFAACSVEYKNYQAAIAKDYRQVTRESLYRARRKFAKKCGYKPKKHDKNTWIKLYQ